MFDSIYHMKFHFCREYFLFFYWDIKNQIKQTKQTTFSRQKIIVGIGDIWKSTQRCYGRHDVSRKSINH